MKNLIKSVDAGSPLRRKVKPGWELLSVNDHPIADVLDYKFYTYDRVLHMEFRTAEGKIRRLRVRKDEGTDVGLHG